MITKEMAENRWKFTVGGAVTLVLGLVIGLALVNIYQQAGQALLQLKSGVLPPAMTERLNASVASMDAFAWSIWFSNQAVTLSVVMGALLGGSLIAGEVGKGTIFFLLSKPLTRTRILLTKYAIASAILLAVVLIGTVAVFTGSAIGGYQMPVGGTLLSALLLWLGGEFIVGVALLLSILTGDVLKAVGFAVGVGIVIGLPAFVSGWQDWALISYWYSFPAYIGATFPWKELVINLIAAALPVVGALYLFNRKAY